MVNNNLLLQSLNLLSQQLAKIPGEEIYGLTGAMAPDIRELIGLLKGLKVLPGVTKDMAAMAEKLIPFFSEYGKATWPRTELTDLGLRVGDRGMGNINVGEDQEEEILDASSES